MDEAIAEQPFGRCYWVLPGKLLAGCFPGDRDAEAAGARLSRLLDAGIRTFVNLMEVDETDHAGLRFIPYDGMVEKLAAERGLALESRRFPIRDISTPTMAGAAETVRMIEASITEGRPVYVHCWGGRGRTGTIVGCYLLKNGRATPANFVDVISALRRNDASGGPSPETAAQIDFVQRFWQQECATEAARDEETRARFTGCLLGLAVGDAVGTTLEFKPPGSFEPIRDMVGGGPFELQPGEWTDDASLALCLAESLIERQGFDPADQLRRYVSWWREGHLSSTGACFDIGTTTREALSRFVETGEPYCGSTDPRRAGNGSLMRLAPIAMAFARDPSETIVRAGDSSRTTHGAPAAVDACRFYAGLLVGALKGANKEEILSSRYCPVDGYWNDHALVPEVDEVAKGSFKRRDPPEIKGSGYVVKSLEAALWAFHRTHSFREGCLTAVNLGDDADTTGAIYGQIAGAFYGAEAIPEDWRAKLAMRGLIEDFAAELHRLCLTALAP